ncbi:hypothetical protein BXY66_2174 [Shimia isoporae]|uniref:Uncharacterized protein n=1 Tax=Shimia isoporae TaxID=647720 RepID=A0A4R1NNQ8_9RHOB|nr:hypothetical protein [Shimia isoporae]TCL10106.1 hypothetical protein BXY66_2174 [Shimia isoporae]
MTRAALPNICGAALLCATGAAVALPVWPHEQAEVFATCSGRMSALTTHQRATRSPEAETNAELVDTFDLMLEAILPDAVPDDGPKLSTQWRARGWSQIASLLADAAYSFDDRRAERATQMIETHIKSCRDLVL